MDRDPDLVRRVIRNLSALKKIAGDVELRLRGGPYDGVVLFIAVRKAVPFIKGVPLTLELTEDGSAAAIYTAEPGKPIRDGLPMRFTGYGRRTSE